MSYAWSLPEVASTTVHGLYCQQPVLVCHGLQSPCMHQLESSLLGVSYMCTLTLHSDSSPQQLSYPSTFGLHEIFKCTIAHRYIILNDSYEFRFLKVAQNHKIMQCFSCSLLISEKCATIKPVRVRTCDPNNNNTMRLKTYNTILLYNSLLEGKMLISIDSILHS